jgi:hypothetical protein
MKRKDSLTESVQKILDKHEKNKDFSAIESLTCAEKEYQKLLLAGIFSEKEYLLLDSIERHGFIITGNVQHKQKVSC